MDKLFLTLTLSLLITGITYSQVFISSVVEGTVLLGPDNVDCQNEASAGFYYAQVEAFKPILENREVALQNEVEKLLAKKKLKKKSQKHLAQHKFDLAKIASEKELMVTLNEKWTKALNNRQSLMDLSLLASNECFIVETRQGNYSSDQLKIESTNFTIDEFDAFIPMIDLNIDYTEEGQWVKKKKSPNCFSRDPNDCYVACYEVVKDTMMTYHIKDMTGNLIKMTDAPLSMKCDPKTEMLYISSKTNNAKSKLSLKSNDSDENLDIISWEKVDCSSK